MKAIIWGCMITLPLCIICSTLVLLGAPCFPGHLGYRFLSPCVNPGVKWKIFPDWILRLFLVCLCVWNVRQIASSYIMEAAVYTSLHCFCLQNYHLLVRQMVQLVPRSIPKIVQMYKELQLLTTNYNWIHGNLLSIIVTVFESSNFIIAAYATIGLYSKMSLPELVTFAVIAFDSFFLMLICDGGFKAAVNDESKRTLSKIKTSPELMRKPIMRRYLRSWPAARIKLGSTNFYDKESPLNLIAFCVGQVVSLLLL